MDQPWKRNFPVPKSGPTPRSNWVGNDLLVGNYPGNPADDDRHEQMMRKILAEGITLVISLLPTAEIDGRELKDYALRPDGVEFQSFPMKEHGMLSRDKIDTLVQLMIDEGAQGGKTYLHSYGGKNRTGFVTTLYLIKRYKLYALQALRLLYRLHFARNEPFGSDTAKPDYAHDDPHAEGVEYYCYDSDDDSTTNAVARGSNGSGRLVLLSWEQVDFIKTLSRAVWELPFLLFNCPSPRLSGMPQHVFSRAYDCYFSDKMYRYSSMDQYLAAQKALRYGRVEDVEKCMMTRDYHKQRKYANEIKMTMDQQEEWEEKFALKTAIEGNMLKYQQNVGLLKMLLSSGFKELYDCEADEYMWGIGVAIKQAAAMPKDEWPGQNLFGRAVVKVRSELATTMSL